MNKVLTDLIAINTPQDDVMKTHICSPFREYGGCVTFLYRNHFLLDVLVQNLWFYLKMKKTCRAAPACGTDHFTCAAPSSAVTKIVYLLLEMRWSKPTVLMEVDELGCPACSREHLNVKVAIALTCPGCAMVQLNATMA